MRYPRAIPALPPPKEVRYEVRYPRAIPALSPRYLPPSPSPRTPHPHPYARARARAGARLGSLALEGFGSMIWTRAIVEQRLIEGEIGSNG